MTVRTVLSSIGRGMSWKLGADLLGRLMQYVLLWLAARTLEPGAFGDFTFALSVGYMLAQVADFGLQLYVQRELARLVIPGAVAANNPPFFTDEPAAAGLVGGGLAIKLGLSALSMSLLAAIVFLEPVGNKVPVVLLGLAMIALTGLDYLAYCFRALGRLNQEALAYVLGRGTNLLLGAALLLAGGGVLGLSLAANAAAVIALFYSYNRLRAYVRPAWKLDLFAWRGRLGQTALVGLGIILSLAAFRVDNLLIPPLVGAGAANEALSIYNAAYKLFELTLIVPGVVLAATFPLLCRAAVHGRQDPVGLVPARFARLLMQIVGGLLALGALATLVIGLGAGAWIHLLYGERFVGSVAILRWLALGCIPMYASYGLTHGLLALDRSRAYAFFTLGALLTNVAANLLLVPRIGVAGAAVATFVTELVMVGLCASAVVRYVRTPGVSMAVLGEPGVGRPA